MRCKIAIDEYQMFVNYFEKENREMSLFIQFLWHTGARGSEAVSIKMTDIDFKNNYIIVPNKIYKSQQETILLTDETKQIIQKTIALKNSKTDTLFSWKSATTPFQLLQKLENKLNIKIKGRGLHGFRRSFADKLFKNEFAIDRVQEIMRHRTINTTLEHYKTFNKENVIK